MTRATTTTTMTTKEEEKEKRICLDQRGLADPAVYVIERSHFTLAQPARRGVTFAILSLIDDFVPLSVSLLDEKLDLIKLTEIARG